ncbi:bifunctional 4-hydroxy-2-oxoglutarate aldolase/2-dehydro-3-deoxy-phosphogluconate aldolase [Sphingomonas montana]|uniref:bifunctional 4-hydroxy-2-oxoglutarate aldolase/2-dehydro-3-deoxy-phosphogluconate aldolase n=1 Tax=Sphingomonas montana TaxID=1843236 RepID=UPI00096DBF78|nr:bifunctional 4-hydroxy-2-oxoglutarate aldolase/2-dehydro-3-deoxy-phosphogluconate aldolase [Sphingomonas montana]
MKAVEKVMRAAPVIPVLVVEDVAHARTIAEALVAGGLPVLEVTLRTDSALDVIREMAKVEGAIVGAGTVLNPDDLARAQDAGATFIVSPGLTKKLAKAAEAADIALLPGVANAGDIMRGLDLGLRHFKFFPAVTSGGIPALKSLLGPFGKIAICPTGGVTQATAADWLAIPQVLCVGGSWLVPAGAPDGDAIRAAAEAAAGVAR